MPSRAQTREGISPVHSLVLLQLRGPACITTDHCRSTMAANFPRTKIGGYKKTFGIVTGWVAIRLDLDEVDWETKIAPLRAATWCGTRRASETVGSAITTRRHFRPRCQRVRGRVREREMSSVYFVSVRTRWSNLWEGILMSLAMLKHTA
jgi:hypothetical protein